MNAKARLLLVAALFVVPAAASAQQPNLLPPVPMPATPPDWTASPSFELGYKLPDSCGEFLLRYRFLNAGGRETLATDIGDVGVRSRLSMNVIDLDYNSARYQPGPRWDLRWTIGARIA